MNEPNVLFISIDCLRSDFALGEYGATKSFFEFFDREGILFDTMIAAASTTTPAVASYMTGTYPYEHGVRSLREFELRADVTTLAEVFEQAGYRTSAHVCGPLTRDTNLDKGFATYEHRNERRTVYTDWWDEFKGRLDSTDTPWFTYLHLWEVHSSRDLPSDATGDELSYEASVRGLDERLEEVLDLVDLNETIIAITGDHGESIYDGTLRNLLVRQAVKPRDLRRKVYDRYLRPRGIDVENFYNSLRRLRKPAFPSALHRRGHGYHVYDFLVRVPFGLVGPEIAAEGRVPAQVRQVDIFPTLLSAAGLDAPVVEGQNLLTDSIVHYPAFSRACGATLREQENWLVGVRHKGWKFVKGRERPLKQLFSLDTDPNERHNVIDNHPTAAARLEGLVDEFMTKHRQNGATTIAPEKRKQMETRLEHLGYI